MNANILETLIHLTLNENIYLVLKIQNGKFDKSTHKLV